jgi:hypothetical protein
MNADAATAARGLEVKVHVEGPWNAVQRSRRDQREQEVPFHEMVCAENNEDHFNQGLVPISQADSRNSERPYSKGFCAGTASTKEPSRPHRPPRQVDLSARLVTRISRSVT